MIKKETAPKDSLGKSCYLLFIIRFGFRVEDLF